MQKAFDVISFVVGSDKAVELMRVLGEVGFEIVQNHTALLVRSDNPWPPDWAERFWWKYPRRIGKAGALRKLDTIRKAGKVPFEKIESAVMRYAEIAVGMEAKFIKHPETWLSKGCWDDDSSVIAPNGHPPGASVFDLGDNLRREVRDG